MIELYDEIGDGYRRRRRPDPRIAAVVLRGLGDASSVVNVGAGAGSYEPSDPRLVAVDPSMTMIRQRPRSAAAVVCGSAVSLPFRDAAFEASLAILTLHHWPDQVHGLRELRRVANRRVVILTWDPATPGFWLSDYFPEILTIDRQIFPSLDLLRDHLGRIAVFDVPIPRDCRDGFLGAYWCRPRRYLEESVRAAISTFSKVRDAETGLVSLTRDLDSGDWHRRYASMLSGTDRDLGYRLIVASAA